MSVRTQCKWAYGIGCQAVHTPYIDSDKPTSEQEEIKVSPPNLSLRSPINFILTFQQEGEWDH